MLTVVGQQVIQLAKTLNGPIKTIVASWKHEKQSTECGTDKSFDYRDVDVVKQVKKKYNNISYVVHCAANEDTLEKVYKCATDEYIADIIKFTNLTVETVREENRMQNVTTHCTKTQMAGDRISIQNDILSTHPEARWLSL